MLRSPDASTKMGSNIYSVMGSIGGLPVERQLGFNRKNRKSALFIENSDSQKNEVQEESRSPDWWTQLPGAGMESNIPSIHAAKPGKVKKTVRIGRKKVVAANKISLPQRMSDSGEISGAGPESTDKMRVISMATTYPPYWTIGSLVIILVSFVCMLIQYGGFAPLSINPLFGTDESTLILIGAKYAPLILAGEYWRLATAIFLSSGAIHILLIAILILLTASVERSSGFWRAVFVFLLSGSYGCILSCLLIPESVSVGASGAFFGYVGILLSDLISSWSLIPKRGRKLAFLIASIVLMAVAGLTPYIDNFTHIGGFIMGFLCALMLLPNILVQTFHRYCHGMLTFLLFPGTAIIYMLSLVIFIKRIDTNTSWCSWCYYLNCVNISGWCPALSESKVIGTVNYMV